MSEENAELEALEEIESTLNRHWMRKPRKEESVAMTDPSTSETLDDDRAGMLSEDTAETLEHAQEESVADPDADSGPISVIDYGIRRAMRDRPSPQQPVKRGRGRPRKNF